MVSSDTALAIYNVNRALQEVRLHCDQIDEAMDYLKDLKKTILHNISIAKESVELLYNAQRETDQLVKEQV
jgi:hypothetical protein